MWWSLISWTRLPKQPLSGAGLLFVEGVVVGVVYLVCKNSVEQQQQQLLSPRNVHLFLGPADMYSGTCLTVSHTKQSNYTP